MLLAKTSYKYAALYVILLCLVCPAARANDTGKAEFSQNPVDISNLLEKDSKDKEGGLLVPPGELLQNWDSFKEGLDRRYGLQFGIDYQALYQSASSSPGESDAAKRSLRMCSLFLIQFPTPIKIALHI